MKLELYFNVILVLWIKCSLEGLSDFSKVIVLANSKTDIQTRFSDSKCMVIVLLTLSICLYQ